ncbi:MULTISPECIES: hypothetical protein [Streptacidiphilus]|uniref:DUF4190 domain-containing protein n=1 Tax=Streptacidiphilus cavernicola TaxID=3342716 RepID=A0ABV6UMH8_9ACTN|nr:hypothetical protein [Streptacidiphilus jeojiense]
MATSQPTSQPVPQPASRLGSNAAGNDTAVASFIIGLLGLFILNVVLGPLALALAAVSLARGTRRRGRALLGLALGAADLVVLGVLMTTHTGGIILHLGI